MTGAILQLGIGIFIVVWCFLGVVDGPLDWKMCCGATGLIGGFFCFLGIVDKKLPWLYKLPFILIWTGVCFFLATGVDIFISSSLQNSMSPQEWEQVAAAAPHTITFSAPVRFTVGSLFIISGGVVGWLLIAPPNTIKKQNLNTTSTNNKNYSGVSLMDNNEYGMTRQNENWNGIDQMIKDIANSDTSLRSLQQTNPDLANKIQQTFDYYDPQAGVFGSWSQRLRGEGRTKMLEVLNTEQELLIHQAAMFEQQVMNQQKSIVEYKVFLAENAMKLITLKQTADFNQQAFGKGMMPEHYSQANYEKEMSDIRLKEYEARQSLDDIREEMRIKRNLDSILEYETTEDKTLNLLHKQFDEALKEYEAVDSITGLSEQSKAKKKEIAWGKVSFYEKKIKARQNLLNNE